MDTMQAAAEAGTQRSRQRDLMLHQLVRLYALYRCWCLVRGVWRWSRARHQQQQQQVRMSTATATTTATTATTNDPDPALFPQWIVSRSTGLWLRTYGPPLPEPHAPTSAPPPRAILFVVHGYNEHSGRYAHWLEYVRRTANIACYALDHQGHGASLGDRCYIERFEHLVDDYAAFIERVTAAYAVAAAATTSTPPPPCFLMGHSMGGAIAIQLMRLAQRATVPLTVASPALDRIAFRPALALRGAIFSAPAVEADPNLATPLKRSLARLLSSWLPRAPVGRIDPSGLTSVDAVVQLYRCDPLVSDVPMCARFAGEFLHTMDDLQAHARTLTCSMLVVQGACDPIVRPQGVRAFFDAAASSDKEFVLVDDALHETLNERADIRERVQQAIVEWIVKRV